MPKLSRIGLIVKPQELRARPLVSALLEWAGERQIEVAASAPELLGDPRIVRVEQAQIAEGTDIVVVLGGDGTMISTARTVSAYGTPVLGVNFGTLGYLTEFTDADLFPTLEEIIETGYETDPRVMLESTIERNGEVFARATALNDAVINKSALARIIEIDCWIDGRYVTFYRADGLIVSTPTGSTAYNASAGGPILMPSMGAFVLNPICPHTLSNRPLVVPDRVGITLNLRTRQEQVMLTIDGQIGFDLAAGDRILMRKSDTKFNVITPRNRNYFQVLRDKLRWGGQIVPAEC